MPVPANLYAFPWEETENSGSPGMTLRDYFAGQALAGLLVTYHMDAHASLERLAATEKGAAIAAYRFADAMLAEREAQS